MPLPLAKPGTQLLPKCELGKLLVHLLMCLFILAAVESVILPVAVVAKCEYQL